MLFCFDFLQLQSDPPSSEDMEKFANDMNGLAAPLGQLSCAEYCFSVCMNPLQHPSFDPHLHHLIVMTKSLCNACGGVIFLIAHEGITHKEIDFTKFKTRMLQSLSSENICEDVVVIQQSGSADDSFWGTIVAKKSQQQLSYNFSVTTAIPCVDVRGQLQFKHVSARRQETSKILQGDTSPSEMSEILKGDTLPVEKSGMSEILERDTSPQIPPTPTPKAASENEHSVLRPLSSDKVHLPEVTLPEESPDVFTPGVGVLKWDQNKRNWQGILKEPSTSKDDCVKGCAIWEPKMPMQVTPDRQSWKYFFPSDDDFYQTFEKVKTHLAGFAIANRSWLSLLPELDVTSLPKHHLCDILTVTEDSDVCLWVIVSESTEQIIQRQIQYMFTLGRAIKHQIASHNRLVPNLAIRCMLHSTNTLHNDLIENTLKSSGIKNTQDMLWSCFQEMGKFEELQRGIALLLMSRESLIRNCAGDEISVKFSAKQALTLLERQRVTYISSPPGTGKTLCGISLYREYGRDKAVYICTTQPLLQYLRHNGCHGILVRDDQDMSNHIGRGTFENKQCVIIDESHHLKCSKLCFEELFHILDRERSYLFVLADNEYQSFDIETPGQIRDYIWDLSTKVLKIMPEFKTFKEMFRNTRKVTSFVQHAMVDTPSPIENVTCTNMFDGEGIMCITMDNLSLNEPKNSLVQYLRPLLTSTSHRADPKYQATEVAVLFDERYPHVYIEEICDILQTYCEPRITTQTSEVFPRSGIVVDKISTFIGLDAPLCIFILSPAGAVPHLTLDIPSYKVFLGSRATREGVFVVPKIDADLAKCMKFDHFNLKVSYTVNAAVNNPEQIYIQITFS